MFWGGLKNELMKNYTSGKSKKKVNILIQVFFNLSVLRGEIC